MSSQPHQPHPDVAVMDYGNLVKRLRKCLRDAGIVVLHDDKLYGQNHKALANIQSAITGADTDYCENKSSPDISVSENDESVDILLMPAAYIDQTNHANKTPLHLSAEIGDTELVELFLRAGAKVDAQDSNKQTPLHVSAWNGHKHVVAFLLIAGAKVDAEDSNKQTPLHVSAWNGHKHIVKILLIAGAKVDAEDYYKQTPLHLSAKNGHKKISEIILTAGAEVDAEDSNKQTPLHLSAMWGQKDIVEILLTAGAKVDAEDRYKQTPLHVSARFGHKESVEILLTAGANVDAENTDKQTPLHLSAGFGRKEIIEILLRAGANVDHEDNYKHTPLFLSILRNHIEEAKVLLRFGASVNKRDIYGDSVLDYMNEEKKTTLGLKSVGKIAKICNWIFSTSSSVKTVQSSVSTTTQVKQTKTVSATFTGPKSRIITSDDSSGNKAGRRHVSRDNPARVTSEPVICESAVTSSGSVKSNDSFTPRESGDLCNPSFHYLGNIRQKVEDHWANFSPVHEEGWETSCSLDVRAEVQAGRIVIPTTINITNNKKTVINYGPGTQIHLAHADLVPMNSTVNVNRTTKSSTEYDNNDGYDDGDDDDDDSNIAI